MTHLLKEQAFQQDQLQQYDASLLNQLRESNYYSNEYNQLTSKMIPQNFYTNNIQKFSRQNIQPYSKSLHVDPKANITSTSGNKRQSTLNQNSKNMKPTTITEKSPQLRKSIIQNQQPFGIDRSKYQFISKPMSQRQQNNDNKQQPLTSKESEDKQEIRPSTQGSRPLRNGATLLKPAVSRALNSGGQNSRTPDRAQISSAGNYIGSIQISGQKKTNKVAMTAPSGVRIVSIAAQDIKRFQNKDGNNDIEGSSV